MANILNTMRRTILNLNLDGSQRELDKEVRRTALGFLKSKLGPKAQLQGLAMVAQRHAEVTGSWIEPDAILRRDPGCFDTNDLRYWLRLSHLAGVAAVPAKPILELSEDEMSAMSGVYHMEDGPTRRRLAKAVQESVEDVQDGAEPAPDVPEAVRTNAMAPAAIREAAMEAMDQVPEGWMVRSARCGPSTLKALAGVGLALSSAPETRFGPDLEVGPGWVRLGNRRMVDMADARIVQGAAQGPDGKPTAFLARPWVKASRWMQSMDPHREGSPFAGPGAWPCEWRAFVEQNKVVGVSFYYAWCGEVSAVAAQKAVEVRDLAQKIVDQAAEQQAFPATFDIENVRQNPAFAEYLTRFPQDQVACTLDFIETDEGLLLLEGGPPYSPFGGGHPCGFAGIGITSVPDGVAFKVMDGVNLADPKTWSGDHDRTNAILSWDDVEALALQAEPGFTSRP